MTQSDLWNLGWESIKNLEVEKGILASGREEAYGCIFGRDSLVVSLLLLQTEKKDDKESFLPLVKKILRYLGELQGVSMNIESGEEPGKIIHEFRRDKHEHLTASAVNPWYVYPDGAMRNYDSVDSTLLFLIALYKYGEISGDHHFIEEMQPAAMKAIEWLLRTADDTFISYSFSPDRKYGGLRTQSWMDSRESLFYEDSDELPSYPISPLEVEAYAWAALMMWSVYFKDRDRAFAEKLLVRAERLKKDFNGSYVLRYSHSTVLAYAIDGRGRRLSSPRSSMGHVLWAAHQGECILDRAHIPLVAERLLKKDMFVVGAGVRTLSSRSLKYDPQSYHNGSIWPHDTAILAQGLKNFGFNEEARRVRDALITSYTHFGTPLELYTYRYGLREYQPPGGQRACRVQAWSAAGLLATLSAIESHLDARGVE